MTPYARSEGLEVQLDDGILSVELNRPDQRNAINAEMLDAMISVLVQANEDESVRVIVLSGRGPDFCAGSDLIAKNAPQDRRPRVGSIQRRLPHHAHRIIPLLLGIQTPVVCIARGWVAGLGLHLAVSSDVCLVADSARIWEPFMARGFTPDSGGAWLLPRLVGLVRARELLIGGRELTGTEAAEWGLIHQSVPESDLDQAAQEMIAQLAAGPTVAIGLTKWLLNQSAAIDLEHHLANEAFALELSSRSSDFREGLAAFQERRPPRFEGR